MPKPARDWTLERPNPQCGALSDGPISAGAANGQVPADPGNGHLLIQQLQQYGEQALGKTGKPQKRMRQDGKGSQALIVFAKIALDIRI